MRHSLPPRSHVVGRLLVAATLIAAPFAAWGALLFSGVMEEKTVEAASMPSMPMPEAVMDLPAEMGAPLSVAAVPWTRPLERVDAARFTQRPPSFSERVLKVASGDTLMKLLTDAGIDRVEAHRAITALSDIFDPRRLRIGQEIRLALSDVQAAEETPFELVSLSLRPDVETEVRVGRTDEGAFEAQEAARQLDLRHRRAEGRIDASLYLAAEAAQVPIPALMSLIHVLSFDIDFQRDIRKGDRFELLFETLHEANGAFAKAGELLYARINLSGKDRAFYRYTTLDGETDYFDEEGQSVRRTLMRTPIDGARLSSHFGMRKHPILGYSRMHKGTDFAAPRGTPIYAAGNGTVESAGRNGGYGNYIRIRHNSTYSTAYAHLKGFARGVRRGTRVEQGQVIGYVGTTGRSTGPHLHYEVHMNGKQVNPRTIKLPSGRKLAGEDLDAFAKRRAEIDALRQDPSGTQVAAGR